MPHNIRNIPAGYWLTGIEIVAGKVWMAPAQRDHTPNELKHLSLSLDQPPIEPGKLVVLAPDVIVSALGSENFVAGQQHRYAPADHQDGDKILSLSPAKPDYLGIIGFSLYPTIPAQVIVSSIPILLAIRFIVFVVVANQVAEGEPVMAGDEINAVFR